MTEINGLFFNDIEVENEFRWLIRQRLLEDDVDTLFDKEVNFIQMDSDLTSKIELPAVAFSIFQGKSVYQDSEQIQRYTPFTVEINVYTSGDSKVLKNRELCNKLIALLQSNGPLQTYYNRGLYLDENNEVTTILDSAYRRVIRMSGLCDNQTKLIKGE